MIHRHIHDKTWTIAAIDSLLERGDLPDWQNLAHHLRAGDRELTARLRKSLATHPELRVFVEAVIAATEKS